MAAKFVQLNTFTLTFCVLFVYFCFLSQHEFYSALCEQRSTYFVILFFPLDDVVKEA